MTRVALTSQVAAKSTRVTSLLPDTIDHVSWAEHLGLSMVPEVASVIESAYTTRVFTNTRLQCERWYQVLLDHNPDLAGSIALPHGSLDRNTTSLLNTIPLLSLPLMVENLRGRLTSEKLADRIAKMKMQIYKTNVSTSKK
ncbi:MAG: hypothetical protein SFY67_12660 [Candidatus Melainabacteria bacterium]|nr:hypothetical protein [Candidatus Melainabacteria bacterium]